jgi:hypothetical protein
MCALCASRPRDERTALCAAAQIPQSFALHVALCVLISQRADCKYASLAKFTRKIATV